MIRLRLENTESWNFNDLSPFFSKINRAYQKMVPRFYSRKRLDIFWYEIFKGLKLLFLVLDHDNNFYSFATVTLNQTAEGETEAQIWDLAGMGGFSLLQVMPCFEAWARDNGACRIIFYGRIGWKKKILTIGFKMKTIKFEKEI